MIPYMLLVFIPILFCNIAVVKKGKNILKLHIGKSESVKENNLVLTVFFIIFLLLLVLRNVSVGRDLDGYKYMFDTVRLERFGDLWTFKPEFLFYILIWLVGALTENYQWFLAVVAVITVLPIASVYCEHKKQGVLQMAIFINMSTFIMMFSGLRQAIAMSIGMLAFRAIRDKKVLKFLLLVLLAVGFHLSAVMLLLMYPIYNMSLKKKHLLVIVPFMLALFIFNKPIFSALTVIYNAIGGGMGAITQTGAFGSLLLFALLAVFAYIIPDESLLDKEIIGLRNLLLLAVALQCFAPLHSLAMRMNYYYILFIPMVVGRVVDIPAPKYKQVAKLGGIVITVFFIFSFVMGTYESYVTGISSLDTVPYIPFWKG